MRSHRRVHPRASAGGARPRLLVVDADALTRWSLAAYLAPWFDVHTAASPAAAEQILSRGPVRAVVLPEGPGNHALARLESRVRAVNAAVLIVHTGTQAHPRTESSGVPFLEKPFDLAILANLLRAAEESTR